MVYYIEIIRLKWRFVKFLCYYKQRFLLFSIFFGRIIAVGFNYPLIKSLRYHWIHIFGIGSCLNFISAVTVNHFKSSFGHSTEGLGGNIIYGNPLFILFFMHVFHPFYSMPEKMRLTV